jgi:excisionase family DNA binding protein
MLPEDLEEELLKLLPAILDVQDICSILRVSRKTIMREIAAQRIPAYRADDEWNISRADFLVYLSKNANL